MSKKTSTSGSNQSCPRIHGNQKTHEQFLQEISTKNPNVIILGEYVDYQTKILCECPECHNKWKTTPRLLQEGAGCPLCARRNTRLTQDSFLERLSDRTDILVLGDYTGTKQKILVRCTICGNEWTPSAGNLLRGGSCPECVRRKHGEKVRLTHEQFLKQIPDSIEVFGEYQGGSVPLKYQCHVCGYQWEMTPDRLKHHLGCPKCTNGLGTSFAEQCILYAFRQRCAESEVISHDKRLIGKELDVYLPQHKLAIEFGSWRWHKSHVVLDRRKQQLCQKQGVRLITIYDSCPQEISDFTDCFVYKQELGHVNNIHILRSLVNWCLEQVKYSALTDNEWDIVHTQARQHSRRKTPKEFEAEVAQINPNIEVLSKYEYSTQKIRVRCSICNYEWNVLPTGLLSGRGCPNCNWKAHSLRIRKSHQQFVDDVAQRRSDIDIIGTYVSAKENVLVRCRCCGTEWNASPRSLLESHECPTCYHRRHGRDLAWTQEQFEEAVAKANPTMEVIGKYHTQKDVVRMRCSVCGHEWEPKAGTIISGTGCPKCACARRNEGYIKCLETGAIFQSYTDAEKATGVSSAGLISRACSGKQKTAGGYHWQFIPFEENK